jgi:uncharacterized protein (DUF1697 family)
MGTWIALLRGINVGGRNMLPMKRLAALLELPAALAYAPHPERKRGVRAPGTQCDQAGKSDCRVIKTEFGFSPQVIMLKRGGTGGGCRANPWLEANDAPTSLHVYFLASGRSAISPP